ncbi:MAG: lysophospholipid acyltransferase family protein [Verrucomicrobiota bacterium]
MKEAATTVHPSRLGIFGDLPTRFLRHLLPLIPWFLEPFLIGFWVTVIFLAAAPQRRAVAGNLRAMHPGWSWPRCFAGAWRMFFQFGLAFVDAQRCAVGTGTIDWVLDGSEHFAALEREPGGLLLVTAHMGNYDLAAAYFASRFPRSLHTVRAPERNAEAQKMRERDIRSDEEKNPAFRSHYNRDGNLLGIELARLIVEGEAVAVQADRVLYDVSPMDAEVTPGLWMRLPKGPWALARATRCPCYPVFITRDGWRRYRVTILPAFHVSPDRDATQQSTARWARRIFDFASTHWEQWFVFEPMLERRGSTEDQ